MNVGELIPIEVFNLGGGQNDGLPASHIQDSEFAELENFYPFGSKLVRRKGMRRLTSSPYALALTSLFAFKQATGSWLLLVGAQDAILKLDGSGLVALSNADGAGIASNANPWHFRQYKGEVLGVREGDGRLRRITADLFQNAGIDVPGTAVSLVDGAAGSVEAGDYYYVVTFYNQGTTAESNPSPASAKLTHGASKRITVSSIPVSSNGQVDARRIYRTLLNQRGEYFFVGQINDNFTTTFDDNVVQDNLGRAVSFSNGLPPTGLTLIEIFAERLFSSDGKDVFFSPEGLPQSHDELDFIPVFEDDGHLIRVLHAHGAQLVVGKTNAIHFITGAGPGSFQLSTLSNKHGVIAPLSMQSAEGILLWLAEDNVYRSDGVNPPVSVSTVKVRAALDAIPDEVKAKAVSALFPELSWYVLSIGETGHSTNRKVLVYNYKADTWTTFRHAGDAPAFLADFFDSNYGQQLYAVTYDGHVYEWNSGTSDDGVAIAAKLKTKAYGRGGPLLGIRNASILCPAVSESVRLRIYGDRVATALADRTVSLDRGSGWKTYNLSTLGKLASQVQLALDYSGTSALELEALSMEARGFQRRRKAA